MAATASQTVGPFFRIGLEHLYIADLAPSAPEAGKFSVRGRVLDADGEPVNDAVLELWQANTHGKYAHPEDTQERPLTEGFAGFGRVATDATGAFEFTTVKPGRVPGPGATIQAPHILVAVFMRGLLIHLVTRIYFPDEPANEADPILSAVPAARRGTLIARRIAGGLEWNVVLQGKNETVFFDY